MIIEFAIRQRGAKHPQHDEIEVDVEWDDPERHPRIMEAIYKKYPNHYMYGYCNKENSEYYFNPA